MTASATAPIPTSATLLAAVRWEQRGPPHVQRLFSVRARSYYFGDLEHEPLLELPADIFDQQRNLLVRYAPVSPDTSMAPEMRFGEIFAAAGILDFMRLEIDPEPHRALLVAARPDRFWLNGAARNGINIIYPVNPADPEAGFSDSWEKIFPARALADAAPRDTAGQ